MSDTKWQRAADLPGRLMELREVLGDTIPAFTERFGRGENQFYQWQKGAQLPPPRVLQKTAKAEKWPRAIFEEGGPRPRDAVNRLVNASRVSALATAVREVPNQSYRAPGREALQMVLDAIATLSRVARLLESNATPSAPAKDAAEATVDGAAVEQTLDALGEPAEPEEEQGEEPTQAG